jgi:hypothetical protein
VRLLTLDLTDPLQPAEVSLSRLTRLPYAAETDAAAGQFVYTYSRLGGLRIVDIRRPGHYRRRDDDLTVAMAGRYAYIVMGETGLLILDTKRPDGPHAANWYSTPGAALAVVVEGGYALVVVEQPRAAAVGYD